MRKQIRIRSLSFVVAGTPVETLAKETGDA